MSKNTHMDHIEDLMFNEGVNGTRKAIEFLRDLRDMLQGHTNSVGGVTVKWDGAPAIFAGIDPSDGKFFVSKKGIFNKNPLLYKNPSDMANLSSELKKKFTIALKEFKKLGIIKGVFQGDLMFTTGDIKVQAIDGEKFYTFQPNTIVYAVPVKSKLGRTISRTKIGVVWHTTYTGRSLSSMKGSFGKNIATKLKKVRSIWSIDATYSDAAGQALLSPSQSQIVNVLLRQAGKAFQDINGNALNTIKNDQELKEKIKVYNNTHVRAGEPFTNPKKHVQGLFHFISDWYDKKIGTLKSLDGKAKWEEKKKVAMNNVFGHGTDLITIFELMNILVAAKQMLIEQLNKTSSMKLFLRTRNGFQVTAPEGFVGIDHIGNAVKLVDRLEFSRANFSPNILKGWDH